MTAIAAALLRDVPRFASPSGNLLAEEDVLTALTAALDGVDERAGEMLNSVTPEPWTLCRLADQTPHSIQASYGCINGLSAMFTLAHVNVPDEAVVGMTDGAFDSDTADANARFIAWARNNVPTLLAQNAALRAERDEAHQHELEQVRINAENVEALIAAEAEVEKLRGAGDFAKFIGTDTSKDDKDLVPVTYGMLRRLRAALTTETDNE